MADYKGHIMNGQTQIGMITSEGGFDQAGKSMTKVNGKGNIVDLNGKILGKAHKNGSFVYYFNDSREKYTIGKANYAGHCLKENHCMPMDDMDMKKQKH